MESDSINIFLFLYPIEDFFNSLAKDRELGFRLNGYSMRRIDEIINARYREKGYKIYWLLFSSENAPEEADTSKIKRDIFTIYPNDKIIVSGIPFRRHVDEKVYPDPGYVLAQLPKNVDSLVIGGFHLVDCVGRMAEAAYRLGMNVRVDEDVTDIFFVYTVLCGQIPFAREKYPSLNELVIFEDWKKEVIQYRKERPWLPELPETA